MRILIVEDDVKLAAQLKKGLEEQGHSIAVVHNGKDGIYSAETNIFDILILDVMLPGMDGFSIVRSLRARRADTPILMLTARDSAEDIIAGLDAGADDYLTKPFSFRILSARLRALGRRKQVQPDTKLQLSDLILNPSTREVKRGPMTVALTPREFIILELLMRNPGRVLTRARLIDAIWGNEREVGNNTVDVFIYQIRAKIEPPSASKLIHTIRGVGYTIREEESG
ncbi:MAG TPA: response regulator transcription factor [Bryobacteraceae bacterium]